MKKIALIVLGVLVLAAAGWSALWFTGRGAIETALTAEFDRLRAEGLEIEHGEREVGGFPAAYDVTYRDVIVTDTARGIRYTLPRITGSASAGEPDRLRFRFPESFAVAIPATPEMREHYAEMPEEITIDVDADDLVVTVAGRESGMVDFAVEAQSVLVVSAEETAPVAIAVELVELDASGRMPETPDAGTVTGRSTLGRLEYVITVVDPDGVRTTVEGISDDLSFGGSSNLRTPEQWQALFAGPSDGEAQFFYEAGETDSQIKVQGNPQGLDGTLGQTSGATSGVVRIGDGQVELRGTAQNNSYEITPEAAEAPLEGRLQVGGLEVVYLAPIAPSQEMSEFNLRLALTNVEADEKLWALIDPEEALDHAEAHLVVELAGTGRLVPPPTDGSRVRAPIEIGNVEIAVATLDALGAAVAAEGGVEFLQPLNLPQGEITVRMQGVQDAVRALVEAGLLQPGTEQMATLLTTLYTQPGASEGELVSRIAFTLDGISVNGLPVSNPATPEPDLPLRNPEPLPVVPLPMPEVEASPEAGGASDDGAALPEQESSAGVPPEPDDGAGAVLPEPEAQN